MLIGLKTCLALGDNVVLTALCRDLYNYLNREVEIVPIVPSAYNGLFKNAPWLPKQRLGIAAQQADIVIDCNGMACTRAYEAAGKHYVRYAIDWLAARLNFPIVPERLTGAIYLTEAEKQRPDIEPYWLLVAGGKVDLTVKLYPHFQRVVDLLPNVKFMQVGNAADHHPRLRNVIYRVDKTSSVRDFIGQIYHAEGVLCPITAAGHIAACFDKPAVILAGGYEPPGYIQYDNQTVLSKIGSMPCCAERACLKYWAQPRSKSNWPESECLAKEEINGFQFARCMTETTPEQIAAAVLSYGQKSG